ncbi:MAG: hypothetical protein ACSHW0_11060 [Thalassotalea sp.]
MITKISQKIVVVFMLFAFIGQAFGYSTMSCDMAASTHQHLMSSAMSSNTTAHMAMGHMATGHMEIDHAAMGHTAPSAHDNMAQQITSSSSAQVNSGDCCDVECDCPANACSSLSLLFANMVSSKISPAIEKIHYLDFSIPQLRNKSLFRPPIFS